MANLTFVNNVSITDAIVTFNITDATGTNNKLTVPGGGGTVAHPTDAETAPWSIFSTTAAGLQANCATDQTEPLIVNDANAIIHYASDPVFGVLATTTVAPPPPPPPPSNPVTPVPPANNDQGLGGADNTSAVQGSTSALDNDHNWDAPNSVNTTPAPPSKTLPMKLQLQEQTQWCWAAVALTTEVFYDHHSHDHHSHHHQCTLVNNALGQGCCCVAVDAKSPICNRPYRLDLALTLVGHLNVFSPKALTFAQVQTEIHADHPLGARIQWTLGGGHFVLIYGYSTPSSPSESATIAIADPWSGETTVSFSTFPAQYHGGGTWTHSYTTK